MRFTYAEAMTDATYYQPLAQAAEVSERHLANLEYGVGNVSVLVLLDLTMPGISGYDVLAELRRRHSEVPVVVVSADIQLGVYAYCRATVAVSPDCRSRTA